MRKEAKLLNLASMRMKNDCVRLYRLYRLARPSILRRKAINHVLPRLYMPASLYTNKNCKFPAMARLDIF